MTPPPAVTANATVIPDSASPFWSRTSTTNGLSRAVLTVSVWLLPDIRTTVVATNVSAFVDSVTAELAAELPTLFTARTWKVYSVPAVRLEIVTDVAVEFVSVHVPPAVLPS